MIRLMVYANEFKIEGLVASASGTPGEVKVAITRTDLIREIVTAYGKVLPNLSQHGDGWPTEEELQAVIKSGNPKRGKSNVGAEHDTEGSRWIVERVNSGTPERPLNIAIWGGQSDLAQALWRVRQDKGPEGLAKFVQLFRVHDISDQDGIANWMRAEFPGMFYILSKAPNGVDRLQGTFRGMYLGGDESLTSREWIEKNISSKGPLGALYPLKAWTSPNPNNCLKEGDTPSWFFFLPLGGNDPSDPTKPGWGGQYQKSKDGWYRDLLLTPNAEPRQSINRWRQAFQEDFARRMSWCVSK